MDIFSFPFFIRQQLGSKLGNNVEGIRQYWFPISNDVVLPRHNNTLNQAILFQYLTISFLLVVFST